MELSTVAVVLALTLVLTGVMFALIARQIQGRGGMSTLAAGLILFGVAFSVPDAGHGTTPLLLGIALDCVGVAALLFLVRGLQLFVHRPALSWRLVGTVLAGYAGITVLLVLVFGPVARPVALNVALALLFGLIAYTAAREAHSHSPRLRLPLVLLALVLAVLTLMSAWRVLQLLTAGAMPPVTAIDRVFDAFIMLSVLLLGPNLLWLHSVQLSRQLDELTTLDPLTRLLNEQGMQDLLKRHFGGRHHEPVSLMHVDVDQFHRVNDKHGETAGDDVLKLIALAIESSVRADDLVARVGGEEFVVCCMSDDPVKAATLGERIRAAVADMQTGLSDERGLVRCTVSVGISHPFGSMDEWDRAWREAEVSLHAAKDAGANCVVHPSVSLAPA